MKVERTEPCSECKSSFRIENRTKWLCMECNHIRKYGVTYRERMIEKQKEYQLKQLEKEKKKPTVIKQFTKKEQRQKNTLADLKRSIRETEMTEGTCYCKGCGKGSENLDCSHILSVRHRKDLELERENINLFCRVCHEKWESNDIESQLELNSFEKDLNYIQSKDSFRFNRLLIAIKDLIQFIEENAENEVRIEVKQKIERVEKQYSL